MTVMIDDSVELTNLTTVEVGVENIKHDPMEGSELTTFTHTLTVGTIEESSSTFFPHELKANTHGKISLEQQTTRAFIGSQSLTPTDHNLTSSWEEMEEKPAEGGVPRTISLALGSLIASIEEEERETDEESIIDQTRERVRSWLFSAAQHGLKATSCNSQGHSSVDRLIEKGKYEVPLEVIDYLSTIRRGTKREDRKIRKAAETIGDWLEVDLTYKDAGRRQKAFESREEDAKERARKMEDLKKLWTSRW